MTPPENRLLNGRDNSGRFAQGNSANPGGRPKGLAGYIREQTGDGRELVDFVRRLFRGENIDGKKPGLAMRLDAATWLSDRGFGRPVQGVVYAGATAQQWDAFPTLSDEDLRDLVEAARAINAAKANVIEGEGEGRVLESNAGIGA